jgi:hypothetical protein
MPHPDDDTDSRIRRALPRSRPCVVRTGCDVSPHSTRRTRKRSRPSSPAPMMRKSTSPSPVKASGCGSPVTLPTKTRSGSNRSRRVRFSPTVLANTQRRPRGSTRIDSMAARRSANGYWSTKRGLRSRSCPSSTLYSLANCATKACRSVPVTVRSGVGPTSSRRIWPERSRSSTRYSADVSRERGHHRQRLHR